MSPIKHTDSVLCNCPICLAVRAMRTRLLCRSHVLFPCAGVPPVANQDLTWVRDGQARL